MAKIMLVEDDNNLREIYEARLLAEGYEIVAAKDGEEALAMAVKEKPDLIIADIMMPKISGFDMLDILRSTAETKNTKVIVMTALSQAEDKTRADKLGADRYLVKSQVTLEDVAKTARDVLEGVKANEATPAVVTPTETPSTSPVLPVTEPATTDSTVTHAVTPADEPSNLTPGVSPPPTADPAVAVDPAADEPAAKTPTDDPAEPLVKPEEPSPVTIPVSEEPPEPTEARKAASDLAEPVSEEKAQVDAQIKDTGGTPPVPSKEMVELPKTSELPVVHEKVIQPPADMEDKPDLHELLAQEEAKETAEQPVINPPADTVIKVDDKTDAVDEEAAATHEPGQVIGPQQTPGSDPTNPHDIAL